MTLDFPLQVRRATLSDANTIVYHRRAMFESMGHRDAKRLDRMDANFEPWLLRHMAAEQYLGWFVVDGDSVVAGAGLWLIDWPANHLDPCGTRPYILNVFTEPAYRRQGLARHLMTIIIDYCRAEGYEVVMLHASHEGRAVYDALGFEATNEMRLMLDRT
jgi:GNAT superfamily N-acetyltransferase